MQHDAALAPAPPPSELQHAAVHMLCPARMVGGRSVYRAVTDLIAPRRLAAALRRRYGEGARVEVRHMDMTDDHRYDWGYVMVSAGAGTVLGHVVGDVLAAVRAAARQALLRMDAALGADARRFVARDVLIFDAENGALLQVVALPAPGTVRVQQPRPEEASAE